MKNGSIATMLHLSHWESSRSLIRLRGHRAPPWFPVGHQLAQPFWRAVQQSLSKLKMRRPLWSNNSISGSLANNPMYVWDDICMELLMESVGYNRKKKKKRKTIVCYEETGSINCDPPNHRILCNNRKKNNDVPYTLIRKSVKVTLIAVWKSYCDSMYLA